MTNHIISIIIPVYNVSEFIFKCLNSVASQTYVGSLECILVDDCGNDDSIRLAEEFISTYDGGIIFRMIHHDKNRGLSAARNTGVSASIGDYVYFLDSDDCMTPNCIELLSAPIKKKEYDFVCGSFVKNGSGLSADPVKIQSSELNDNEILNGYINGIWPLTAWNKLVKKAFLVENNIQFMEGLIHEDNLWCFHLARLASSVYVQNEQTYIYNIRSGSIMTSRGNAAKHTNARLYIVSEMSNYKLNNKLIENYILVFSDGLLFSAISDGLPLLDYYSKVKAIIKPTPIADYIHYHHNFKTLLKYIHYSMPDLIGCEYRKLLAKWFGI